MTEDWDNEPMPAERFEDATPVPIQRETPVLALPISEPEEYILGWCIVDEGTTLSHVLDRGLTSADFHLPHHAEIFRALYKLHSEKVPIGLDTLAGQLNGRMESVGGIVGLMRISDPLSLRTSSRVDHYLNHVLSESARRRTIRAAQETIEKAQRGEMDSPPPSAPLKEQRIARILTESRFIPGLVVAKPTPIFTAADTTICTPGNLTALYSQAKAGKTATIGGMLAATMQPPGAVNDTLGFKASNPAGKAVIHFDTEQSRYDWQQMVLTATRRAKLDRPADWLCSHLLTGLTAPECRMVLDAALATYAEKYNGIYAVFIDGIGDLVTDVNEPKECNEFVAHLHGLAIKHDCAIINILHLNPTSDAKGRGHLGSQLERKSESNLMLEKTEDGTTRLYATKQRGKTITKNKALCFKWSDEAQMHVTAAAPESSDIKKGRPKQYTLSQISAHIPQSKAKAIGIKALFRFANELTGMSESALRILLDDSTKNGEVLRTELPSGGFGYHLNTPGQS